MTSTLNVPGTTVGRPPRPFGAPAEGGAGAAKSAAATYIRCVVGSSPIFREPVGVGTLPATRYLSGPSWWMTVSEPSAFDANTSPVAGSYPAPSTPIPIGTVVIVLPA